MKFYHGTKEGKVNFGDCAEHGTCFTDDRFIACEYAERFNHEGGEFVPEERYEDEDVRVYTAKIDVDEIATVEDVEEIIDEEIDFAPGAVWEVIDKPEVQDAIAEAGFDAVAYEDDSPTGTPHDTIRIVGDCEVEVIEEEILTPAW